ncbi:MAG: HEAT repeat domain-containing protein [Phycisphaerae bacterium]|nr:HEAT repeat domain-containing protein [Phycisphaerae bacterium]NUQ46907.1 HEAT repeat domain-containing protein [Phycisphaerae bacterium]
MNESDCESRPAPVPKRSTLERCVAAGVCVVVVLCAVAVIQRDRLRAWWWTRQWLGAVDAEHRRGYQTLLTAMGDDAAPSLLPLLADERAEVRAAAAGMLIRASGRDVRAALTAALSDSNAAVRDEAAHVLAFAHGESALAELSREVFNARGDVALAICVAIGRMETDAAGRFLADILRHHPEPDVRAQAAELLGLRRDAAATAALTERLSDDAPVDRMLFIERRARDAAAFAASSGSGAAVDGDMRRGWRVADYVHRALEQIRSPEEGPATSQPVAGGST